MCKESRELQEKERSGIEDRGVQAYLYGNLSNDKPGEVTGGRIGCW
jgi:hypothetical protein